MHWSFSNLVGEKKSRNKLNRLYCFLPFFDVSICALIFFILLLFSCPSFPFDFNLRQFLLRVVTSCLPGTGGILHTYIQFTENLDVPTVKNPAVTISRYLSACFQHRKRGRLKIAFKFFKLKTAKVLQTTTKQTFVELCTVI